MFFSVLFRKSPSSNSTFTLVALPRRTTTVPHFSDSAHRRTFATLSARFLSSPLAKRRRLVVAALALSHGGSYSWRLSLTPALSHAGYHRAPLLLQIVANDDTHSRNHNFEVASIHLLAVVRRPSSSYGCSITGRRLR